MKISQWENWELLQEALRCLFGIVVFFYNLPLLILIPLLDMSGVISLKHKDEENPDGKPDYKKILTMTVISTAAYFTILFIFLSARTG
jgi:hypothetical protein